MADRFPLILNTSTNQIQEIPSGDNLDLTGVGINNAGIITASSFSGPIVAGAGTSDIVAGIITATQIDLNGDIDVDGHTNLDNVSVSGVSTFTGAIDANGDLDVDGHTNLDNVSIAGITTMNGDLLIDSNSAEINLKAGLNGQTGRINWTFHTTDTNYSSIYLPFDSRTIDGLTVDGNDYNVSVKSAGSVRLYASNAIKLYTNPSGIVVNGNGTFTGNVSIGGTLTYEDVTNIDSVGIVTARDGVFLPDLKQLKIGNTAAAPDLYLWHNSSTGNSNISNKTGDLFIQGNNGSGTVVNQIAVKSNAAVELNYQGSKMFETTSTGIKVVRTSNNPDIKITGALGSGAEHRIFVAGSNSESLQITGNTRLFFNANDHHFRNAATTQDLFVITSNGDVNLPRDSKKLQIGAGQDLYLEHDGNNSVFRNTTGDLYIQDNSAGNIYIQPVNNQTSITAIANGRVELGYGGNKKFETTSSGATVTGSLTLTDDLYLSDANVAYFGTNNDMRIYHSGTHGYIKNTVGNLYLMTTNSEYGALFYANGAAELRYDNVKKFETTSTGVNITGAIAASKLTLTDDGASSPVLHVKSDDEGPWGMIVGNSTYSSNDRGIKFLQANSGNCQVRTSGQGSYVSLNFLQDDATTSRNLLTLDADGSVYLRHQGTIKLGTAADRVNITGHIFITDGSRLYISNGFGNGHATIRNEAGNTAGNMVFSTRSAGGSDTSRAMFTTDGHFIPYANNTYDLGNTATRWRNIYVNDLQLSNEAKKDEGGNDVDGTWGDFTIQEGESDLFLINNRSGKKYKFNLTEVS